MDEPAAIEQINSQLTEEMTELDHHVKQLKEYRNDMVLKSIPNEEQSVKSAFESLLKLETNGSIQSEKYVQASSMDHIHIPFSTYTNATDTINCLGCGQIFNKLDTYCEPAYYIHCIKECDKYKILNMIEKCDVCQKLFVNRISMKEHMCQRPPKPDWMTPSMFTQGLCHGNVVRNCLGCGEKFFFTSNSRYSFDHLVHMIEDCSAYKDLNLIVDCNECHFKFPNQSTYRNHVTRTHPMKKPIWMNQNIFRIAIMASRSLKTKPVPCHGCGKELRKRLTSTGLGAYLLEDYIHMIEDCSQYKELNLIKICDRCGGKFINPNSFHNHKC